MCILHILLTNVFASISTLRFQFVITSSQSLESLGSGVYRRVHIYEFTHQFIADRNRKPPNPHEGQRVLPRNQLSKNDEKILPHAQEQPSRRRTMTTSLLTLAPLKLQSAMPLPTFPAFLPHFSLQLNRSRQTSLPLKLPVFVCQITVSRRKPCSSRMEPETPPDNLNPTGAPSNSTTAHQQPRRTVTPQAAAKRRERPPLRYTEDFDTPSTVNLDVIGVVRSPYKVF